MSARDVLMLLSGWSKHHVSGCSPLTGTSEVTSRPRDTETQQLCRVCGRSHNKPRPHLSPTPHLSTAPPVLQQQVVETGCQLVVGDALTKAAVIVLLQPPVQHHLQLTCTGERSEVRVQHTDSLSVFSLLEVAVVHQYSISKDINSIQMALLA